MKKGYLIQFIDAEWYRTGAVEEVFAKTLREAYDTIAENIPPPGVEVRLFRIERTELQIPKRLRGPQ